MNETKIDCYILPSEPYPLLLPVDCVAEVETKPTIEALSKAPAGWMIGHVNWQNQRLPLMSYAKLLDSDLDESNNKNPCLVVLNPIPDAARKAYSGLLCYGDVAQVSVDNTISYQELPAGLDKRYVEAMVSIDDKEYIIPRLTSLGVAFTYI